MINCGNILVILEKADIFLMYDKLTTMEGTLQVDEYQMLKTIRHRLELDLQKEVWSLLSIYYGTLWEGWAFVKLQINDH